MTVPEPLQLAPDGRIVGPNVVYASPFPTPNGNWGFAEPAWGMASHTEVGFEHSVDQEFENPAAQASAFCAVSGAWDKFDEPDGTIIQFGPIAKGWMAWTQEQGNPHWRGVENEDGGNPANPYTPAQIGSNAQLLELFSFVDGFPIQPTDDPLVGRGNIFHSDGGAQWGGHDCPGDVRRSQRPAVVVLAQAIRAKRLGQPGGDDMPQGFTTTDPTSGGVWVVRTDDGEVDAFDGAPYLGGLNNHPEFHAFDPQHPIVGISAWKDPSGQWGYRVTEWAPETQPDGSHFRHYRFPRSGQYAK